MSGRPGAAAGAAVALGSLTVLAVGFLVGRAWTTRDLRERIEGHRRTETVAGVAGTRRAGMALAYEDPERALHEMDTYTWDVPTMPTPFVGVAPRPGRFGCATIDQQQLRHPTDLEIPKPAGRLRVFVTGGSTAFGTGAPSDAETIPALLQTHVDAAFGAGRFEIVNAACPAWVSTHERAWVESRLSEFEPDLVVSLSGNNDAHFGFLGLHVLSFRTYSEHFQTLLVSDALEASGEEPLPRPWNASSEGPVPPAEVLRRLEKNLRLLVEALRDTGAPYVFALQPTLADTKKPLTEREREHKGAELHGAGSGAYFREVYALYREALPELALERFRFVDAADALDGAGAEDELFLDSYHFGDKGNRLVAARLFELLRPELESLAGSSD